MVEMRHGHSDVSRRRKRATSIRTKCRRRRECVIRIVLQTIPFLQSVLLLGLSDTSSELHGENTGVPPPPGLSMGIRSHLITRRCGGLGNGIQQWQVNAIVDSLTDDGGDGGVDEALRRLEGQINPQRRKEKALKVDGWVRTIQERMAAGDFGNERPRFFEGKDHKEEDDSCNIDQHETGSARRSSVNRDSLASELEDYFSSAPASGSSFGFPLTPVDTVASLGLGSPMRGVDAKPAPEDVVPKEILQSRVTVTSRPSTSHGSPMAGTSPALSPALTSPTKVLSPTGRKSHRSWVLNVRADVLAQQFESMIDRELIMDDWMSCQDVNVLDWAQYLKERAQFPQQDRQVE